MNKHEMNLLSVGLCVCGIELYFIRIASEWFLDTVFHCLVVLRG